MGVLGHEVRSTLGGRALKPGGRRDSVECGLCDLPSQGAENLGKRLFAMSIRVLVTSLGATEMSTRLHDEVVRIHGQSVFCVCESGARPASPTVAFLRGAGAASEASDSGTEENPVLVYRR